MTRFTFKSYKYLVFNKTFQPSLSIIFLPTRYLNDQFLWIRLAYHIIFFIWNFIFTASIHMQIVMIRLWENEVNKTGSCFALNFNFTDQWYLRLNINLCWFKRTDFFMHICIAYDLIKTVHMFLNCSTRSVQHCFHTSLSPFIRFLIVRSFKVCCFQRNI